MDFEIRERLTQQLIVTTRDRHIQISPTAARFIEWVINAILEDPHRSWVVGRDRDALRQAQFQAIERIPEALRSVAESARTDRLTAFDLLHGVPPIVDKLCPLEKVR